MSRLELTDVERELFSELVFVAVTDHEKGQPYLAKAYWRLIPVACSEVDVMAVDKFWRVYVNFEAVEKLGFDYAVKALNHEVWHLLKRHHERTEFFSAIPPYINQPLLINIASDLEINDDLKGLVPDDALFPHLFPFELKEYETLDYYYDVVLKDVQHYAKFFPDLIHQNRPDTPPAPNDPQNGENSPSGALSDEGEAESGGDAQNAPNGGKQPQGEDNRTPPPSPKCGSAATGDGESYELPEPTAKEQQQAGTTETDIEELIDNVQKDIEAYAEEYGVGSGAGKVVGELKDKNNQNRKKIDWRKALRADLSNSVSVIRGKTTYLRTKPARRQPVPDVLYPAMVAYKPTLGIAIDVSGSNLENLYYILTQIQHITKSLNIGPRETKAFAIDTVVSNIKPVKDPLTLLDDVSRGGGTRMTPGYLKLAELNQNISLLITDGEVNDYPKEKPLRTSTTFITLIVPNRGDGENLLKQAEREIGPWSKIIVANLQ